MMLRKAWEMLFIIVVVAAFIAGATMVSVALVDASAGKEVPFPLGIGGIVVSALAGLAALGRSLSFMLRDDP